MFSSFTDFVIARWAASRKKVANVLSRCNTKRRKGAKKNFPRKKSKKSLSYQKKGVHACPSFGMTTT